MECSEDAKATFSRSQVAFVEALLVCLGLDHYVFSRSHAHGGIFHGCFLFRKTSGV